MVIKPHNAGNIKIAEVTSDQVIIQSAEDGLDLMGNIYYQGFDKVIVYEKNITPGFFDLKTKIAGEILQNFPTTVSGWLLLEISKSMKVKV